ncbi:sigma-54 interaction domain-containing protein [Ferrimonas lipolytica]|nr:sigma-54 dependent transcriptional regulator [Ferrimonas lipolytica]
MMLYQLNGIELDLTQQRTLAKLGWQAVTDGHSDVALVSLQGQGESHVATSLKQAAATTKIALIEADDCNLASTALANGADDYLLLPIEPIQLEQLFVRLRKVHSNDGSFISVAPVSRQMMMLAQRAALVPATVLLTGESGVGKERVARYIHEQSPRAKHSFVSVNCAAIPDSMLEALLFGHVKGAFTNAYAEKMGKFEYANHGTLLLDEISEMSPMLQAKLLRVLQEREVERLGSHTAVKLDIKIIAATNKDLRQEVAAGRFRQDLFYRLDVLPLHIVPLRDRCEDILPIAQSLLGHYEMQYNAGQCQFSSAAKSALIAHSWPGNVRELDNRIQRALVMRHGASLQPSDLGLTTPKAAPVSTAKTIAKSKKQIEFQYIVDILKQQGGSRSRCAEELGITPRALRYKLAQMRDNGIDIDEQLKNVASF